VLAGPGPLEQVLLDLAVNARWSCTAERLLGAVRGAPAGGPGIERRGPRVERGARAARLSAA
jgi:hypothetical protein